MSNEDGLDRPGNAVLWDFDEWPYPEITPKLDWAAWSKPDFCNQVMFAQASFLEFARIADYERFRIVPNYEVIGIKAFFEMPGEHPVFGEHVFLTNIFTDRTTITGTVYSDSLRHKDLKKGRELTFPMEKLSDWFLVRGSDGLGGFTVPFAWNELTMAKHKQLQNEAPFVWFPHRGSKPAEAELFALPKCVQCGKRCIGIPGDAMQPCAICRSGSRRCDCPKCGAPLIRDEKLPDLCARCLFSGGLSLFVPGFGF